MSTALQFLQSTKQQLQDWSWFKRSLLVFTLLTFLVSSFMFLTGPGTEMRIWMANSVIITQHREWAWIFVGTEQRDIMVKKMHQFIEENAEEKQQFNMIKHQSSQDAVSTIRKNRTIDQLIKVEDISGTFWKGKRMYVFDPKTIRLMTPEKSGEGEKITSMVKRTGAVAGVNAGGFDDPEGLGNGFAAIGAIISGGEVIYTDQESYTPQHIVGFTKDGTLVIGKYNMFELQEMGISEAASFYPRVIANGKPLPINDVSRAPRTAIAQKADGTVIFIIVDGRQAHSVGATLKEIQDIFLADDAVNAGFLDGGASSELVVNGELVTKPSSRYGERRLPSAYLVYDHPEQVVANRVWDGITKINAGGAFDHPDFLKEQAQLRNNPKAATTPTTTKPVEPVKPAATEPGTSVNGAGAAKPSTTDTKKTNESQTPAAPTQSTAPDPTKPIESHSTGTGSAGGANLTIPHPTNGTAPSGIDPSTATAPASTAGTGNAGIPNPNTGSSPKANDTTESNHPATVPAATPATTAPAAPANDTAVKAPAASTGAAPAVTTPATAPTSDASSKTTTPAAETATKPAATPAASPGPAATNPVTNPAAPAVPTTPSAPVKTN